MYVGFRVCGLHNYVILENPMGKNMRIVLKLRFSRGYIKVDIWKKRKDLGSPNSYNEDPLRAPSISRRVLFGGWGSSPLIIRA